MATFERIMGSISENEVISGIVFREPISIVLPSN